MEAQVATIIYKYALLYCRLCRISVHLNHVLFPQLQSSLVTPLYFENSASQTGSDSQLKQGLHLLVNVPKHIPEVNTSHVSVFIETFSVVFRCCKIVVFTNLSHLISQVFPLDNHPALVIHFKLSNREMKCVLQLTVFFLLDNSPPASQKHTQAHLNANERCPPEKWM